MFLSDLAFQELLTQQDQLDLAASYITDLRQRIEKLNERKEEAIKALNGEKRGGDVFDQGMSSGPRLPVIELKDLGCSIEVILISGLQKNFMLYEVISVLEEEGAEVVNASFSVVDDKIFHTLHAQVNTTLIENLHPTLNLSYSVSFTYFNLYFDSSQKSKCEFVFLRPYWQ